MMMIPITRKHQEGEEHARRSIVSSSVRWLIEGTVHWSTKYVYVYIGAYYQSSMQYYVSYVVMLPERQPWWYDVQSSLSAAWKIRELSVQEGAEERKKAH